MEIAFERLGVALEITPGTAEANPTHYLPIAGRVAPRQTVYRPEEARGTREQYYRSAIVKRWSEWEGEGPLDTYNLPVLLAMAVDGNVTPTTPTGATNARLWTFTRSPVAVTEKTGTLFYGDPNIQIWRAPYGAVQSFTISADASGDDGVTMEVSGVARTMESVSAPTWPAQLVGPIVTPIQSQLWLDTTSPIGTTEITGRVVSAEFSVDGLRGDPKFLFAGPSATKTFERLGVAKTAATLQLTMEVFDLNQFNLLMNEAVVRARLRMNGPEIEAGFNHFVEIDIVGVFDEPDWTEVFGSNVALSVTITSQYDATLGYGWAIRVQNDRTML